MITVDADIKLRWPTLDDAQPLFELIEANRRHLQRWMPWVPDVQTQDDEVHWIEDQLKAKEAGDTNPPLIVYRGRIVGSINMIRLDMLNRSTEIGYWLAEDFQGLGIMTRSCEALLTFVFDVLEFNRIEIHVDPDNQRSIAIPVRLGCVHEGIKRKALLLGGQFFDMEVYSLLEDEWEQRDS